MVDRRPTCLTHFVCFHYWKDRTVASPRDSLTESERIRNSYYVWVMYVQSLGVFSYIVSVPPFILVSIALTKLPSELPIVLGFPDISTFQWCITTPPPCWLVLSYVALNENTFSRFVCLLCVRDSDGEIVVSTEQRAFRKLTAYC